MREGHLAKWYHLIFYPDWLRRLTQRPDKVLAEFVAEGMRVADVGCGLGLYTVEMAKLVGSSGKVYAVDMQPQMLGFTRRKAKRAGLIRRIQFIQCTENDLSLPTPLDFVLTMYVTHEVRDTDGFFRQVREAMAENAKYLLVEPSFHVNRQTFESICSQCQAASLDKQQEIKIPHSHAAIFMKRPIGDSV